MPTDGEGNKSQDAIAARKILSSAQQQQRNCDDAVICAKQTQGEFDGHTPGDSYVWYDAADGKFQICCPDKDDLKTPWYIASVTTGLMNGNPEVVANAKLLAAAPRLLRERDEATAELAKIKAERDELVRACKELAVMRVYGNGTDLHQAIEAIEKALARIEGGAQ